MEDRHTSRCPNSVLIVAHDGMEVCDGAHWLFVMKNRGNSGEHRTLDQLDPILK
jgi:hypothetical protein